MNNKNIYNMQDAVAVIGMACRFPGAKNINEFWQNLKNGVESISFFSEDEASGHGVNPDDVKNPSLVRAFGVLEDSDKFDAEFFGFSPREAELLDPQSRVFLECAWHAVEDAGYDVDRIDGRTGVYASASISTYLLRNLLRNRELIDSVGGISALLGNDKDHIPSRVSYAMNFQGPSIAVGTACSSSLVAVHLACQGLLDYHCDMALAGGVTIHSNQGEGYFYNPESIASPDGHCRTFDSSSAGTISGSGAGVVILKRLEDAINDKDNISAVILASAVNNDGSVKVGYTAPGIDGQSIAVSEALHLADIEPESISYIETHGTATKLGDPIEIAALKKAFAGNHEKSFCALGSVKSNFGHLDSAAGIAGFIKTVLALRNKQIPPSLHFESANTTIKIEDSPFYINKSLSDWVVKQYPRRAGVSSFAMGGTNAHVILQEPEPVQPEPCPAHPYIIPVSAKTPSALDTYCSFVLDEVKKNQHRISNIAYTFAEGRKVFPYRKALLINDNKITISSFAGYAANPKNETVFMFSGLGSHYENMAAGLLSKSKVFRENLEKCSDIFNEITGKNLLEIIYPKGINQSENTGGTGIDFFRMVKGSGSDEDTLLNKTIYAHPAIFSIEYALAQLMLSLGIKPAAVTGHSIGEYTALCVSGALTLRDALTFVTKRAEILESAPAGEMLTIDCSLQKIAKFLTPALSLSAVNDAESCVIAGSQEDIDLLKDILKKENILFRAVKSQKAFHSKLLLSKTDELKKAWQSVQVNQPEIPVISNLTGNWLLYEEIAGTEYASSHSTETVRFYDGIRKLIDEQYNNFIEIGPGQNLTGYVLRSVNHEEKKKITVSSVMKNIYDTADDYTFFLSTLSKLWVNGTTIEFKNFFEGCKPCKVSLPGYPFEHKRYWIDEKAGSSAGEDTPDFPAVLTWKKTYVSSSVNHNSSDSLFIIIADNSGNDTSDINEAISLTGGKYKILCIHGSAENAEMDNISGWDSIVKALKEINAGSINIIYPLVSDDKNNENNYILSHCLNITGILDHIAFKDIKLNLAATAGNVFSITGEENISPAKAAIYGFVKSIPDELSNVNCYFYDYSTSDSKPPKGFYKKVVSLMLSGNNNNTAAIRNNSIWIPYFDKLEKYPKIKDIKEANHTDKNKAGISGEAEHSNDNDYVSNLLQNINRQLAIKGITEYDGLQNRLDELCSSLIIHFLAGNIQWGKGTEFSPSSFYNGNTRQPELFRYLLHIAEKDNLVEKHDNSFRILKDIKNIPHPKDLSNDIKEHYPFVCGLVDILMYAVSCYDDVFSGKKGNVDVFYNDESGIYKNEYHGDPLRFEKHDVYKYAASGLLKFILDSAGEGSINILEAGGGTGKLTSLLIPELDWRSNISYHFTDISRAFISEAAELGKRFSLDFMKYDTLDITADAVKQGFQASSYNIILAYDVIHTSANIKDTISNLNNLLAPGGIMMMVESVHNKRWTNMIWGLQTGWWNFKDERIKNNSPLLSMDEWDELLKDTGSSFVSSYPVHGQERNNSAFGMILMQKAVNGQGLIPDLNTLLKNHPQTVYSAERLLLPVKDDFNKVFTFNSPVRNKPVLTADYEYYTDNFIRPACILSDFLKDIRDKEISVGEATICISNTSSAFRAAECMLEEYLYAIAVKSGTGITLVHTDDKVINNLKNIESANMFSGLSSARIYLSAPAGRKKYSQIKKDKKHNVYERPGLTSVYNPPVNDTEKEICEIWQLILGIDKIGTNDNFFELGGDSLIATRIITRIKKDFGIVIPLPEFFSGPTVSVLSKTVTYNRNIIEKLSADSNAGGMEREEGEI